MKRKFTRFRTYNVRICGEVMDIHLARLRYRCRECLGKLEYYNSGLACAADREHTGFLHKDEAEREYRRRLERLEEVESVYQIKDGKIVVKED